MLKGINKKAKRSYKIMAYTTKKSREMKLSRKSNII